jgi:hypothetical protein
MKTSSELRAEVVRLRQFALGITDKQVMETVQELVHEIEDRARRLDQAG